MEAQVLERQTASALGQAQSAAVAAELSRVLQSEPFKGSARQRKFLSVIVDWTLRGKADEIKETTLAVMVFGRHPSSFDAQRDPIVRVEAARIRKNLELFYAGADAASPVRIGIPKGHYRPTFFDPANEQAVRESNSANKS